MQPGRIVGATRNLGAPEGWDKETQGVCGHLAILDSNSAAGPKMTSAWLPTPEEIAKIANGAPVMLDVLGRVHPPVYVWVGDPPGEEEKP